LGFRLSLIVKFQSDRDAFPFKALVEADHRAPGWRPDQAEKTNSAQRQGFW
jgi:hypothetical protein